MVFIFKKKFKYNTNSEREKINITNYYFILSEIGLLMEERKK